MKKNEEKATYESPQTKKTTISLESGFMQSSADIQNPNNAANGQIEEHEVNKSFDFGFADQDWEQQ
ncbi:hypothetical protein [uncultured Bacteroides sp.]|uniref:hypothetical protein n=1 Tax=uncultured Bacteroides sp. TaxID=162156 RepID=UPI0026232F56|nr:hypothetical protein [uncultured Bacteroides sp.]